MRIRNELRRLAIIAAIGSATGLFGLLALANFAGIMYCYGYFESTIGLRQSSPSAFQTIKEKETIDAKADNLLGELVELVSARVFLDGYLEFTVFGAAFALSCEHLYQSWIRVTRRKTVIREDSNQPESSLLRAQEEC